MNENKNTNLSKINREKMLECIKNIKEYVNENDEILRDLSLIEYELTKKKFGLVWEEHQEQVDKELETQIPVFIEEKGKEVCKLESERFNFLIEGDNLHSLYLLEKTHKGKIDVIYIDPPYNTGNQSWKYNNQYVEKDDSFRHSKWLSFMEKRLRIAKNLLKDDGAIIVTIDDYEVNPLGLLLDEIFGESNRMSTLVVESNPRGRTSDAFFATSHEYYFYYAKNSSLAKFYNLPLTEEQKKAFKFEDSISNYRLLPLRKTGAASRRKDRPKQFYPIYIRKSDMKLSLNKFEQECTELWPIDETGEERVWKLGTQSCSEFIESGDIIVSKNKNGKYTLSQKDRIKLGRKPKTMWISPKYDASAHGTIMISSILGKANSFDYPKSLYAVMDSLSVLLKERKDALVLDFFAGSGTTGHAVLELNELDDGNRNFILCTNNENNICEEITYKRLRNVILGYTDAKNRDVKGLNSNLKYYKTNYIPKKNDDNTNLRNNLLVNIKNLIQLENGISIDDKSIKVFMSEDSIDAFSENEKELNDCERLYIPSDVLLTKEQEKLFEDNNIEIFNIPEYYFTKEIMEVE